MIRTNVGLREAASRPAVHASRGASIVRAAKLQMVVSQVIAAVVKTSTLQSYSDVFRLHIVPVFGSLRPDQLERRTIKRFLRAEAERRPLRRGRSDRDL